VRCPFSTLLHHKTCSLSVSRQVHVENCRERHKFRRVGLRYNAAAVVLFFIRLHSMLQRPCTCIWCDRTCTLFVSSYPSVGTRCIVHTSKRDNNNDSNNNNNYDTYTILLPIIMIYRKITRIIDMARLPASFPMTFWLIFPIYTRTTYRYLPINNIRYYYALYNQPQAICPRCRNDSNIIVLLA